MKLQEKIQLSEDLIDHYLGEGLASALFKTGKIAAKYAGRSAKAHVKHGAKRLKTRVKYGQDIGNYKSYAKHQAKNKEMFDGIKRQKKWESDFIKKDNATKLSKMKAARKKYNADPKNIKRGRTIDKIRPEDVKNWDGY